MNLFACVALILTIACYFFHQVDLDVFLSLFTISSVKDTTLDTINLRHSTLQISNDKTMIV